MTCSDVQRALPEALDGGPNGTFAAEFETHLKSCQDCSDLVSDLKLITSEAGQLVAAEEPSPRVWLRIAAELRAEGLISDPAISDSAIREQEFASTSAARRPILLPSSRRRRWSAWWLAPVAAGLVAAGSYVVSHKLAPQVAQQVTATPVAIPAPVTTPVTETPSATSSTPVPTATPQRLARKSVPSSVPSKDLLASAEPAPSDEDQQFLSVVSTRAPSMRATYENQLNAVNADIRETQAYVNRNPGDADARQHLMDDYQQKALLYQIALDRIQ
jgi:hypothetical protein